MKRFLLLLPAALLAACGSAPSSDSAASGSAASGSAPMIYVSSARPAHAIANCLDSRLSGTEQSQHNGVTDITVGSRSYFVTLTPSGGGSVVKVVRGSGSEPAEEAMRFAIARCVI
ncbi:sugar ABC transporter ATPase [Burkholderia ambifaria]|uniref:sugar ABC transporter ATPase n=1 Tax=Burkholderia ambifaria TaxID=152480 RepID=UPI00158DAA07|nr:sugar ABC transporter ATPase [Burkholderia ambifaria]